MPSQYTLALAALLKRTSLPYQGAPCVNYLIGVFVLGKGDGRLIATARRRRRRRSARRAGRDRAGQERPPAPPHAAGQGRGVAGQGRGVVGIWAGVGVGIAAVMSRACLSWQG